MRARDVRCFVGAACLAVAGGSACATAAAEKPTATAPDAAEADVLRERVARLERRLSDVDARLAVLMDAAAKRSRIAPATAHAPAAPRDDVRVDGSRSIDLTPPSRNSMVDEVRIADEGGTEDDGSGSAITIRMEGDSAPRIDRGAPESASIEGDEAPRQGPKAIYDWAMQRMKAGSHLEAIAAFEDVLERFPSHDLADNAMYWAGACHAQRGDHRLAIDVWQKLPLKYPRSPKVSDALFGMAQAHEALGEPAIAETLYQELLRQYPKAERAAESKRALGRLRPR